MKRTKNSAVIESTEGCIIPFEGGRTIRDCIFSVRGVQVMVDWDLAALYGVETRVMNQSVKRNEERFPERFRFKLTQDEMDELITNCDKSGRLKHYPGLPYVFTEQGIAMLASVLRSVTAVAVSVRIMDAFVEMRRTLAALVPVTQMLKDIQQKQMLDQAKNEERFAQIFTELGKLEVPVQGVFYDGQLWDARALVLKLIGIAKKSLILIDNWATAETLDLFTKKRKGVKVTIITSEHYDKKHVPHHKISDTDIATFNAQYPHLAVRYNETFHDRFLIIDDKELYLIGASLKDLGKKCFGFTKMDAGEIERIKKVAYITFSVDKSAKENEK
jgi:hypothetical protein